MFLMNLQSLIFDEGCMYSWMSYCHQTLTADSENDYKSIPVGAFPIPTRVDK